MATIIIRTDEKTITEHYSLIPGYDEFPDEEKDTILIQLTSPRTH